MNTYIQKINYIYGDEDEDDDGAMTTQETPHKSSDDHHHGGDRFCSLSGSQNRPLLKLVTGSLPPVLPTPSITTTVTKICACLL